MISISRRGALFCASGFLLGKSRVRVLVIDGINNHDWEAGTKGIG